MADHRVGHFHNVSGGAVVLLEAENLHIGVILFKIEDVLNIGTAKGVNTLRIIAHHADVATNRCQFPGNEVLRKVGILVLIHQHIMEFLLILVEHIEVVTEEHIGVEQQIIKIHRTGTEGPCLVHLVDFGGLWPAAGFVFEHQFGVFGILFPADEAVFGGRNPGQNLVGFVGFVIQPHLLENATDKGLGIVAVVNGEVGRVVDFRGFGTQDLGEHRVERSHP